VARVHARLGLDGGEALRADLRCAAAERRVAVGRVWDEVAALLG